MNTPHELSGSELLRQEATNFMAKAAEDGTITESHIFYDRATGAIAGGYTEGLTSSGVRIIKLSDGGFAISAELDTYDDRGEQQDVFVAAELFPGAAPIAEERVGEGNIKTLKRAAGEKAMADMALLIAARL